ncbi:TonB-dependent receptor [Fulvivirgaceae bacterium BMA10]|uniref:TonB-dependent receptor n=1 Tax=Splendidivirga corallicola TaxID=3051826 RepID=A0ABT8KU55_9BACT|nr:TonB-dependent receptor [Fulvivirgaceae bacterium BMA10]
MKKLILYCSLFLFTGIHLVSAQGRTITGKVTDESGETIPGVNILIKETSIGTVSDVNGNYEIDISSDESILVFSSVGYASQEIVVGVKNVIDISLVDDIQSLKEVVVIAYGETEKRKYTGSLTAVTSDDIAQIPLASPVAMLQGRSAGVLVEAGSGQPGAIGSVIIRGVGTFPDPSGNLNTGPLYVIDGIPSGNVSTLNPNDIESMSILKDGTATSLYGSRAAFGVVMITTKQGKVGKTKFTLNTQYGFDKITNQNGFRMMNAREYTDYYREAYLRMGGNPDDPNSGFYTPVNPEFDTNWIEEVTRSGKTQLHEIAASGGTEKVKHFTSFSYFDQEGVVKQTRFQRYTGRTNLSFAPTNKLQVDLNLMGSYVEEDLQFSEGGRSGIFSGAFNIAPTESPLAGSGDVNGLGYNFSLPSNAGHNPIASLAMNFNKRNRVRLFPTVRITLEPIQGLTIRSSGSIDYSTVKRNLFQSKFYFAETDNGRAELENDVGTVSNVSTTAAYDLGINENHDVNVMVGFELFRSTFAEEEFESTDFAFDGINNVSAGGTQLTPDYSFNSNTLVSYLSRVNYTYANKLFVDASFRRDGSSRFGPENRWGTFYAFGLGYNILEEPFLQSQNIFNALKLRASYGVVGSNANIGDFGWRSTYSAGGQFIVPPDGGGTGITNTGSRPSEPGNIRLKWETSKKINFGVDFAILNNRLSGTVDYYINKTNDLVGNRVISQTSGFSTIVDNVGEIENNGIEITLSSVNFENNDLKWTSDFNIAFNNNEILKLNSTSDSDTLEFARTVYIVGQPFGQWYLPQYAGVDIATGSSLYFTETGELTFDINRAHTTVSGNTSVNPDFFGSLNNTITYKGISLSALVYFKFGTDVYRGNLEDLSVPSGNNQAASNLRRWRQPGDITDVPRADDTGAQFDGPTTRWLEDASYIRLRNVNLSYLLPGSLTERIGLRNVTASVRAVNLVTFTKFRGFNPDTGSTESNNDYPLNRTITFGLSATF